jgi:hypothetical protein
MKAKHHFWSSLAVGGAFYFSTQSFTALAGVMLGGFIIDADHVFDQLWSIYHGAPHTKRASALAAQQRSFSGWVARYVHRRKLTRLPLIFHAYELMFGLFICTWVWPTPFLQGLSAGYLLHILLDLFRHHNEFRSPFFYSLFFRMAQGFRRDSLIKSDYL